MTKNRSIKIAVLVLALALITSCFVGTTFAKYTSTAAGDDTVQVAKWAFKMNDTNIAQTETFTFDLFNTIMDEDTEEAETDVVENKIAPGTYGEFEIAFVNESEVTSTYAIEFSIVDPDDDSPITNPTVFPIEFSTDGTNWKTVDKIAELNVAATQLAALTNPANPVTVQWRWAFGDGSNDAVDTAVGIAAPNAKVIANIVFTQVD